jgi:heterodisulfide reductase subunit A-like polyferredoxin
LEAIPLQASWPFILTLPSEAFWLFHVNQKGESKMANLIDTTSGSVMIVGGGIAGMQAALDLADSGFYVHLVEKSPAIGGVMSQLDKTFPTNDCAM